ncbi:hypothetical protein GTA62_11880 [Roseobacter sp. HKCCD9010]|uniref:hypothetical protein n=1 Tax=unclassified Roseobacter TaxID=196798 RepID=UPI0014917A3B|nr:MULTISPECIES: hypothetical protein [unclassified Roseobacter]MBF9050118.1 hypothetical protein [Rhodobacterales bacterium HKCCD4356]NNV12361.1 hypothetical protein [Roseobacter sp. HKCCD7357]NNV16176.1 hypothetical protein [Roseobacter sp. HKCCD8768]NNV25636.1 hypothetical protein [Roseobacter sp. HKCCD8192]NNV29892.1 hypothetical protein [Roseobacter sp. HKCCD9061]
MSDTRVAIAVIHGMGSQGETPQDPDAISFSAGLYRALRGYMAPEEWDGRVAWREIFWADILQSRQDKYVEEGLEGEARWLWAREFVMHRLADAASYRKVSDNPTDIYQRIHGRVEDALENLETVAGGTTPLLIFAHSLGGHIMSNYIYDMQKAVALGAPWVQSRSGFQRFETMAGFLTFGCNIPVFTFAYPRDQVRPIKRPGTRIPADKRLTPWWENLNDKDDVLGMPLGPAGPQYEAMINAGELRDAWINVGNLFTSWNPASHNEYWDHRNFYRPAAEMIRKALLIGPVS